MTELLMPETADLKALGLSYVEERKLWGRVVAKTKRLGRRKRPEPGTVDLVVEDEG